VLHTPPISSSLNIAGTS